jgi:hypothetical protein
MFNFGNARENTTVGTWAMSQKKTGYWNTAVGYLAMEQDTSGLVNTAVGTSALRSNKRSNDNVAIGFNAGYYSLGNGVNGGNIFVGAYAGQGVFNQSTGTNNSVMGFHAYQSFTTGSSNTVMGDYAMLNNTTGNQNVAIGESAMGVNLSVTTPKTTITICAVRRSVKRSINTSGRPGVEFPTNPTPARIYRVRYSLMLAG